MKKLSLIILFVLLLPVTSFSAIVRLAVPAQQISIPYTQVGDGWWSGLAINNISDGTMTFSISAIKDDGTQVDGSSFPVLAHAMKVGLVESFFTGMAPSGRMSVRIQTVTNEPFEATLFVGNTEGGFGFQNYTSGSAGTARFPVAVKWDAAAHSQASTDIYVVNMASTPVSVDLDLYAGDGTLSTCGVMTAITIPANGTHHISPSGCFAIALGAALNFDGTGQINSSSNNIRVYWRIYDETVSPHALIDQGKETPGN